MQNLQISPQRAAAIAAAEGLPPLSELGVGNPWLLSTGAKLYRHSIGRYMIGGYHCTGKDVQWYLKKGWASRQYRG